MLRRLMMAGAGSTPGGDPYWEDVVALLNMPGGSGSTSFPDATGKRVWTPSGDVSVSTELGYNTAEFDGSGDYISAPYVKADLDWWTGDFTIEAWVYAGSFSDWSYLDGAQRPALLGCASQTTTENYWSFGPVSGTNALSFYYYNGSSGQQVYGGAVPTGQLCHLAMMNTSAGIRLAVNGVLGPATAIVGVPVSSASGPRLTLGMINNRSIFGHVRALRITRAVRWASDFTPPAAPFPTA